MGVALGALIAVAVSGCGGQAEGADEEAGKPPTFAGETITISVGFSAGGGFDTYARAVARHLGKHLEGEPNVVVENVPGAGSMVLASRLHSALPADGTAIGLFTGALFLQDVLENPAVQFDGSEFGLVGAPARQRTVCLATGASGVRSLEDLRGRSEPVVFGGTAVGDATVDVPLVLQEVDDSLSLEVVNGYEGTSEVQLAMEQGEVDAGCWGWESMITNMASQLESGAFVPIGQSGDSPHADLPDVPLFADLADGDTDRGLIDAGITLPAETIRTFAVPPDVPEERLEALREALADVLVDPDFVSEAEGLTLTLEPTSGEELEELVQRLYDIPTEVQKTLQAVLAP
jgi:tripartite-type tricarboxylate transporter receptor subunit TctC